MKIIAHRGGFAETPFAENSAEAFAAASRDGFACECDVWASSDGEPAVIHDATLDRTSVVRGTVADFTAGQLRQIRLRASADVPTNLPMLADVADHVSLVEIKPADAPALVQRVVQIMQGRAWTLLAGNEANLQRARVLNPAIPAALVIDDLAGIETAIQGGWSACVGRALLDEQCMARLRDAGRTVAVWTVNTRENLERLIRLKPDSIITDTPRLVRSWLNASPNPARG